MYLNDCLVFENDDFVALNKPSGLLSIPDREGKDISLKILLKEKYENIFTVHRLDRDTSGLIVFAKNEVAHKHLSKQSEERRTEKPPTDAAEYDYEQDHGHRNIGGWIDQAAKQSGRR